MLQGSHDNSQSYACYVLSRKEESDFINDALNIYGHVRHGEKDHSDRERGKKEGRTFLI